HAFFISCYVRVLPLHSFPTRSSSDLVDAVFPLGGFVCITGVSGSGKSTLVNEILLPAVKKEVFSSSLKPGAHTRITGAKQIDRRSEEHTSELQSRGHLVCRLLLEKKK